MTIRRRIPWRVLLLARLEGSIVWRHRWTLLCMWIMGLSMTTPYWLAATLGLPGVMVVTAIMFLAPALWLGRR